VASDNATSMAKAFQAFCNSCALLCYHLSFHHLFLHVAYCPSGCFSI